MSTVYNKSKSERYKNYFTSESELAKPFKVYSLQNGKVNSGNKSFKSWDIGMAGVPLSWNNDNGNVAVDHTDTHTLIIGPTGSKKSRLIVMPTVRILGSEGESMIISDPKAEIFNRTAGYLKNLGYEVLVLNLRSPMHGKRWNPLAIPFEFFMRGDIDKAYEFVNDIAENLIQTEKSENDPFWDNSAGSFFFGLVLLLFKYCKDFGKSKDYVHIGNVIKLRNKLIVNNNIFRKNDVLWSYAKEDPIICSALIGTVETANDTRASILSVFDQKMRMFIIQPNLLDTLSVNDFELDIIGKKPTALFLIVPDEKTGYHGLASLFIKQSYEYMIFNAQSYSEQNGFHVGKLKNRVNYILDEFSSLPTIRDFPAMITAARSRNIRFNLVIQSKHQLIQRYKDEAETIKTNCNNWIFFTSRELDILEEISSLCGKTLADNPQPILSVPLLQRLDKDDGEVLVLCGRMKPCITKLADISLYDGNRIQTVSVNERNKQELPTLDFDLPSANSTNMNISPFLVSREELIASIDKKIAELEAEEVDNTDKKDNRGEKS